MISSPRRTNRGPTPRVPLAALSALLAASVSCGAGAEPLPEDAAPTGVSTSRVTFEASGALVAGATLGPDAALTIVVTFGRRMPPGSQVAVSMPTAVQEESDALWSIPTLEAGAAGALRVGGDAADRTEIVHAGRARGGAGRIVARLTRVVEAGEQLRIGLSGQLPRALLGAPFRVLELDGSDGSVAVLPPENVAVAPVVAAPAAVVRLSLPSDVEAGGALPLRLVALDEFGNVDAGFRGRVLLDAGPAGLPAEYTFTAEDAGARLLEGRAPRVPGVLRVRGRADLAAGPVAVESNPARVWASAPRYRRFFGDAHFHSGSDVASTTVPGGDHRGQFVSSDDAFAYLRDVAALDWGVSAEHDTGMTAATWAANQRRVAALEQPGRFVTLLGYEWTPERRLGHHVVVYDGGASDRNPLVAAEREGPGRATAVAADAAELATAMRMRFGARPRAILIPHVMQPFPNGDPNRKDNARRHETWDGPEGSRRGAYIFNDLRRVAEIYSHHNDDFTPGAFVQTTEGRGAAADQPQLFELGVSNPWSFQHAWSQGHRFGVIGGSDNHLGTPGMDDYLPTVQHHAGLAVVLATELTRAAVFDALYSRRCYATTGPRILLDLSVAGAPMGAEMYRRSGESLAISLAVEGTAPLAAVEVVKFVDGDFAVLRGAALDGKTRSAALAFADRVEQPTIYYLRVRQSDGEMAWSSPVWVDVVYS